MSPETLARLRAECDGKWERGIVNADDLRALLDAYEEALDALVGLEDACASVASWSEECLDFSDSRRIAARDVLAKAGRR